ncbi:SET domain-containing protein [Paraburkholderia sprentiae]|uniref:SET domain-containing protein-lysine N-methyltransferase n=1 Tax=Paraburkholderia sprentiae WSM5005 TaxID=754502 RepID=A0A1I9YRZ6_9BURK|nr:SET domain-containing protein-lysine N-methyltransferase [Paraburkholderia sprentiae]APA88978.1 SET domain-containing protein-lysine N-methyltransferase [Paraburkholderia sprentiae WSM5005]
MKRHERKVIQRRVVVRRSPVHGRGVFALQALEAGERLLEYKGDVITWRTAIRQHRNNGASGHTYYFGLSDGRVIDGGRRGNSARWLNHSCSANCEAVEIEDRVFIHASSAIAPGEELFLDYQLAVDDPMDEEAKLSYACRCSSTGCRGTMLAAPVR